MEYTGLAQITNPENNTALMNTSAGGYTGKAWIGLMGPLGWVWLDGTQATYSMWDYQEPQASDTEYCGLTNYFGWYSEICEYKVYFICFNGRYQSRLFVVRFHSTRLN